MANSVHPWLQSRRTLIDAYKPRPPINYVVGGLFALPSLNMVYGAPGCLKSMLMADMVISVVAGQPWLQLMPGDLGTAQPKQVIQCPAMWIDFDNGVNRTDNRFEALGHAYQLSPSLSPAYYSMPSPVLDASKTGHVMELVDLINLEGAKLVIIDNLATISGGKDENSSEMIQVMANLRLVAERTGAAVVVIHHSRKENGFKGKQGDNMRGFSGIRGAIDTGLYVDREPNSDIVTVRAEKTRDVDIPEFSARFTFQHKPGCSDLESARFYHTSNQQAVTKQDIEDAIIAVLSALPAGKTLSQIKLATEAKKIIPDVGLVAWKSAIGRLALVGTIKHQPGKRGSLEYSLP